MFVFLALAFAVGFIVLGIGSGNGFLADAIRSIGGGGSSSIQSVQEAQKKVDQSPNDPKALLALANALQADAKPKEAIDVLKRYTKLQPNDADVLRQLASLYDLEVATAERTASQLRAQALGGTFTSSAFLFPGSSGFMGALGNDPVDQAVSNSISTRAEEARTAVKGILEEQVPVFQKLVALTPNEPLLYIQLGQAAEGAGERQTAVDAYKKFLQLAPDDPSARAVRQHLRLLDLTPDLVTG